MSTQVTIEERTKHVPMRTDAVVVAVAAVAACGVWSFCTQLVGVDLKVRGANGAQPIGAAAVLATVLVVSLLGPLGATSAASWVVLTGLHSVVAAVLVIGLRQVRRQQPVAA